MRVDDRGHDFQRLTGVVGGHNAGGIGELDPTRDTCVPAAMLAGIDLGSLRLKAFCMAGLQLELCSAGVHEGQHAVGARCRRASRDSPRWPCRWIPRFVAGGEGQPFLQFQSKCSATTDAGDRARERSGRDPLSGRRGWAWQGSESAGNKSEPCIRGSDQETVVRFECGKGSRLRSACGSVDIVGPDQVGSGNRRTWKHRGRENHAVLHCCRTRDRDCRRR